MKTNSREVAFEILKKVFKNNAFSNLLLNEVSHIDLPQKFKNLIFAIVSGTIANKILLETTVNKIINPKKTNIDIKILLWMGTYQLRFLKTIPQYAVVNETVGIAKNVNIKLSGFVNACLKKMIAEEATLFDYNQLTPSDRLCIETSCPKNLYHFFEEQYGTETATLLAQDTTNKPVISFRVNTLKTSFEDVYQKYKDQYGLKKSFVQDCLISKEAIVQSELYQQGLITIQDPASILVVNILDPQPHTNVLDMCAAPGGKLTHLAMKMHNTGTITALEIKQHKLPLIEENVHRLGCQNITLTCQDGTTAQFAQRFDYILLDAPCSGLGVLKRKPEIKIKQYQDLQFSKIIETQQHLLENAYHHLADNGILVYSTCTVNKNENEHQIANFLYRHPKMKVIKEFQIFGFENNTDGFYICKLTKKA